MRKKYPSEKLTMALVLKVWFPENMCPTRELVRNREDLVLSRPAPRNLFQ